MIHMLNKKLQKLAKVYLHTSFLETMNNRELFTNHGLHRNRLGKKLGNLQLAFLLHTTSILNKKTSNPISLGWYEQCVDPNRPEGINQVNISNRNSTRNRKMPVTGSMRAILSVIETECKRFLRSNLQTAEPSRDLHSRAR